MQATQRLEFVAPTADDHVPATHEIHVLNDVVPERGDHVPGLHRQTDFPGPVLMHATDAGQPPAQIIIIQ